MEDFTKRVQALLVAEYGESENNAVALVKKHYKIVVKALMSVDTPDGSKIMVRPCALAICMAESKKGDRKAAL